MARTLTFLVVDQVGSTDQIQRLGDVRAAEIRRALFDFSSTAVAQWNGSIYHYTGDGLMAAFAGAHDAVHAAVVIQRAAVRFSADQPAGEEIVLRAGIHSGEPVITEDGQYVGIAVHLAARLCTASAEGRIVVSQVTRALCDSRGSLRFVSLGVTRLKGISDPTELHDLAWEDVDVPAPPRPDARPPSAAVLVRGGGTPSPSTIPPSPAADHLAGRATSFVGRLGERERIRRAWDAVLTGRFAAVLVSGEAGLGKTTLAAAAGAECVENTAGLFLVGRCDEYATVPYKPFVDVIGHLVAHAPLGLLAEHAARYGNILTMLTPELGVRLGLDQTDPSGEDLGRDRLFSAVVDLLQRVSATRPVYLLIDDAHWAAAPSARLVHRMVRSAELPGVLLVLTCRADELDAAIGDVIRDLRREPVVEQIELSGLSAGEIDEIMTRNMPIDADRLTVAALAERLHQETGGSPFFVHEVLRHVVHGGIAIDPFPIPPTVVDVVDHRIDRLGGRLRELLTLASVIGPEFDLALLAAVSGIEEDDVADDIDRAVAAKLLAEVHGAAGERFAFAHALVRSALLGELGPARRRRTHSRIASVILEASGLRNSTAPDVLRHLVEADRPAGLDAALRAADLAAGVAAAQLAYEHAAAHRRTALELLDRWGDADDDRRAGVALALGVALNLAGRIEDAADVLWSVAQLARGRSPELFAGAALAYGGELPTAPPNDQRAIRLLTELVEFETEPTAVRARALARLAEWRHTDTPLAERAVWCDEAERIGRRLEDPELLGRILNSRTRALHGPVNAEANRTTGLEVHDLAERTDSDTLRFHAASLTMTAHFSLGDWDACRAEAQRVRHLGERLRQFEFRRISVMWDAVDASARGGWSAVAASVERLRELSVGVDHLHGGLIDQAMSLPETWLEGHVELLHDVLLTMDICNIDALRAGYAAEAGRFEAAQEHLAAFGEVHRLARDEGYYFWVSCACLANAARWLASPELAAEVRAVIDPHADQSATMGSVAFLGTARHHLGVVDSVLGDLDAARANLDAAVAIHERHGLRPWAALSRIELAGVHAAAGRTEAAEMAATAALAVADELGLGSVRRRAAMLAQAIPAAAGEGD